MTAATWVAILVAGPGAFAIFLWFLFDFLRMRRRHAAHHPRSAATTSATSAERKGEP